jgi:pyridoxal phosphate enzyme (YggS family)
MIAENIKQIRAKTDQKCLEIGRNSQDIKLIAVSKNFPAEDVRTAFGCGIADFGENKAQELRDKFDILSDLKNKITWHFIGKLQRNKVKYAVSFAEYIHSLDSIELAEEINNRAQKINKKQKVLIEIKTSGEDTKSGLESEEEAVDILNKCKSLGSVEVIGLMTIAPFTGDKDVIRNSFSYLRKLRDEFNKMGYDLKELSMGMTHDFEIAIEEGATFLRIGTAIFGQRIYE